MYIYEEKNWPKFSWDPLKLTNFLIQARHLQGRLMGGMESIGFDFRENIILRTLTQDVVKSSEIEGEILDQSLVRSSVARYLGIEVAADIVDKNVDGVVAMMLDATQKFDQPLTKKRLLSWHASLFPSDKGRFTKLRVGTWRKTSVEVISGFMGKEIVHFKGPKADLVDEEMARFLKWFNQEKQIDSVLKAAIAHLWFVTIHPFDDGNGRIGRAIIDMLLSKSENSSNRFYSLSSQIQKERKSYYDILEKTQKGKLDITDWLIWFLQCLERSIKESLVTLNQILHKEQFWKSLTGIELNQRQHKIINRLLDNFEGKLTSSKWAKIAKCSQDTAHRDIVDLINKGVFILNSEGGRSTNYSLKSPLGVDSK